MEARTLNFFAGSCGGTVLNADPSAWAGGVSTDSRTARADDLFVALDGEKFDGHDFVAEAFERGAKAALVERAKLGKIPAAIRESRPLIVAPDRARQALGRIAAKYRAEFALEAVAVAGSNGKTSTKELAASVLRQKLQTVASAASFNNEVGVPLTLLRIDRSHHAGVFEAGTNHPGELRPLIEMIQPRGGIITSIGREHLEFFGGLEGVLEEEGVLAELIPAHGFLVIHGDEYGAERLLERARARVITVGWGRRAQWRILRHAPGERGSEFFLEAPDPEYSGQYAIQLLGKHQVVNAVYAIVVGKELGLGRAEIQRGLALCPGAKMRLQPRRIDDFIVLDDAYNANADSMRAALETLRSYPCAGRRIAVLGEMAELGPSAAQAHEEIGRSAAEGQIDFLVTVGPRGGSMAAAARGAGLREVIEIPEADRAAEALGKLVSPGDVVLVKASRAARLERVIEELSARFGAPEKG